MEFTQGKASGMCLIWFPYPDCTFLECELYRRQHHVAMSKDWIYQDGIVTIVLGVLMLARAGSYCCWDCLPTVTFLVHLHNLWFYWVPSAYGNAFLCVRQQATGFAVSRGYSNKITQQRKQQNAIQANTVVCLDSEPEVSIFPGDTLTDVRAYYGHSGLNWELLLEALVGRQRN